MYHLKYKSFSYNPFLIIDFIKLTNEAFILPDELYETSHDLCQFFYDITKENGYNWFYNRYGSNDKSFLYPDFCQDKKWGMQDYMLYLDDHFSNIINITYLWLAFDRIYFACHSAELVEPIGIPYIDTYIFQFNNLSKLNTKNWQWPNNPIKKRWWVDDDENERHDKQLEKENLI